MKQSDLEDALGRFISCHELSGQYLVQAESYFLPIAARIAREKQKLPDKRPYFVSLVGSQGSGKTTLAELLSLFLRQKGMHVVCFSLDDFYLRRSQRQQLAQDVHPLFETRGVPGTHDMTFLTRVLNELMQGQKTALPCFDKAKDDRAASESYMRVDTDVDVIVMEGWCWGVTSGSLEELSVPVNNLERYEDAEMVWRSYSHRVIAESFEPLYRHVDCWLMLKAPSFDCVYGWRLEQEGKLAKKMSGTAGPLRIMGPSQVRRFVSFYQRITEALLRTMPLQAHLVWHLDEQRQVRSVSGKWLVGLESTNDIKNRLNNT